MVLTGVFLELATAETLNNGIEEEGKQTASCAAHIRRGAAKSSAFAAEHRSTGTTKIRGRRVQSCDHENYGDSVKPLPRKRGVKG
uniref:Secreted protein n=1 Tax=Heterorhabditis bacteriophora TaxID=37862 RepID=A0A1I7XGF5_HETBA